VTEKTIKMEGIKRKEGRNLAQVLSIDQDLTEGLKTNHENKGGKTMIERKVRGNALTVETLAEEKAKGQGVAAPASTLKGPPSISLTCRKE